MTTTHPDLEPDPPVASPPDTGLDYLALLRAEQERLLAQQLEGIRFTQLQETNNDDPSE